MRFTTMIAINAGVALGYVVARQLLADEAPRQIEQLPSGARGPVQAARARLVRARARLAIAWNEALAERDRSAAELHREYRRYTAQQRGERPPGE